MTRPIPDMTSLAPSLATTNPVTHSLTRLDCPVFMALARSSERTRGLLESGTCAVYEERVVSTQWDFHVYAQGYRFGRATVSQLGEGRLRLRSVNTDNRKHRVPPHPGPGSLLLLAAIALMVREEAPELSWFSKYSAGDFYLRGFFPEFEAVFEEGGLSMGVSEALDFVLRRRMRQHATGRGHG